MAYFSFTENILRDEPIEVYGEGKMARDLTYIDDIVDGVVGVLDHPPARGGNEIYNIGDSQPVGLMEMIQTLKGAIGPDGGEDHAVDAAGGSDGDVGGRCEVAGADGL